MFQSLSDRLSAVFDKLTRRGALTESDVAEAMREVRRALLEADVALDVVRDFTDKVKAKAVGQEVVKSVTPGQMVVKIVHDEMVAMLGSDASPVDLAAQPPIPILMVGLQGSGKTTTTAKIAYRLTNRDRKRVLMASLDTRRPAAQEQLRVLGEQTQVETLPIVAGQTPLQIARRAMEAGRLGGYDVVLLDTAGIREASDPVEQEGVRRAKARASDADLRMLVVEATGDWQRAAHAIWSTADVWNGGTDLIIVNKTDLVPEAQSAPLSPYLMRHGVQLFRTSAKTGSEVTAAFSGAADAIHRRSL